jgi:sugar phosphate isomerase/epimerase
MNHWQERYAITTLLFGKRSLDEALYRIAAAGFRWVELWGNLLHLDPRLNPDVPAVRSLLQKLGLRAHAIHTPYSGLKLGHPQAGLKKSWLEIIGASLAIGEQVGAKIAVVHLTSDPLELNDEAYEKSKEIAIEFIEELRQRAGELGIRLALENLPVRPGPRRRFGTSLQEISKAFPSEDIDFCLDIGHVIMSDQDIHSEIKAAGERLITIHVADNDGAQDRHWLPTQGVLDWAEAKRELARNGYRGRYVLEVLKNPEGDGPDAVLRQATELAKSDGD